MLLKKEKTLFKLEGDDLAPIKAKVVLPINGEYPEIIFKPILRTEYKEKLDKILEEGEKSNRDLDKDFILEKMVEPSYTKEEIDLVPTNIITSLISTIMEYSGISDGNLIKERDRILKSLKQK